MNRDTIDLIILLALMLTIIGLEIGGFNLAGVFVCIVSFAVICSMRLK